MIKVKVISQGGPGPNRRDALAKALFEANVRVLRYYQIHEGYLALIDDDDHAQRIFSSTTVDMLKNLGFTPVLPPDMKAKLTLVFKRLDRHVVNEPESAIADEIMAAAPDSHVENVFVLKSSYLLKVRFSEHQAAKNIKEKGIYLFNLFVAPWQIEFERFTPLRQCMNCYGYGHIKSQCKETKSTRCSECGSSTHSYRDCRSNVKKCLNCGGDHRTFANSCPVRKEAMKASQQKEKEKEKEKEARPLKVVAQKAAQETVHATTNAWKPLINQVRQDIKTKTTNIEPAIHLALPNDLSKEIMIVLLHAHMQNLIAPEKGFRHHAKEALARNNLPELDLGEADSWGILKVIQPPAKSPDTTPLASGESSHDVALEKQLMKIPPDLPTTPVTTPKPDASVRPKEPKQPLADPPMEVRQTFPDPSPQTPPREVRHTSPDPPPPSPVQKTSQKCHRDEDGWDRLMDGTAVDPAFYGIRLFAENPQKYTYSGREEIGQEIRKNRIKWLMTKAEQHNMVIAQKIHVHLLEGNINIDNTMIEYYRNIHKIPNGHLINNPT